MIRRGHLKFRAVSVGAMIFISFTYFAKANPSSKIRKPSGTATFSHGSISTFLENGEVTAQFTAVSDGHLASLSYLYRPDGSTGTKSIGPENFLYLLNKFQRLPKVKALPPECARRKIAVTAVLDGKSETRASCYGVRTITSDAFIAFVNLLKTQQQ